MSWSPTLITALESSQFSWAYILRVVSVNNVPGNTYTASSLPGIGDPIIGLSVRINGATLKPGAWTTTLGSFTVELVGDLGLFRKNVTRGTFVALSIGRPEWKASDYEVIATGQVQQLSGKTPTVATLTCRDLLSALRCRPTGSAGQLTLGYRTNNTQTLLTHDYAIGDSSLQCTTTTGFDVGSAGTACLITPVSGDSPFILTYTGLADPNLTGVSATAIHGTTEVGAAAPSLIQPVIYATGHPLTLFRRFLLSVAGADTHGYDNLPQGDGLSLPYEFVDHQDTDNHYLLSEPSMSFEVVSTSPIDDPVSWMQGWMSAGGFFMTMRQGRITGRSAQVSTTSTFRDAAEITDDDIESGGITWEAWDSDTPSEAVQVTITSNSGDTSSASVEDPATLPAFYRQDYDVTDLLFTDEGTGRDSIIARVYEAHQRIPERYAISCVGLRLAVLAPGDFVRITTRQAQGALTSTAGGLDRTRGIVIQVAADFGRGRVALVVLVYPTSGDVLP